MARPLRIEFPGGRLPCHKSVELPRDTINSGEARNGSAALSTYLSPSFNLITSKKSRAISRWPASLG